MDGSEEGVGEEKRENENEDELDNVSGGGDDEIDNNDRGSNEYEREEPNESMSSNQRSINTFNFLLTNARSLAPKMDSFIENFSERDTDLGVVTENWLCEGAGLLRDGSIDLRNGEGIGAIHCGRNEGRRGGGVGIFYQLSRLKVVDISPNNNQHAPGYLQKNNLHWGLPHDCP